MKLTTLLLAFTLNTSACTPQEDESFHPPVETPEIRDTTDGSNKPHPPTTETMKITVNQSVFTATLVDNAASRAFQAMCPITIEMDEMNNNEKYSYLSSDLPTASSRPGTIQNGELMLFGSSCLVLFYKTFPTSYSYTRIGKIDNPSQLQAALGSGSVSVKFETITIN